MQVFLNFFFCVGVFISASRIDEQSLEHPLHRKTSSASLDNSRDLSSKRDEESDEIKIWRVFASNPRPVSFFSSPRFEMFASGRHIIHVAPVPKLFENLFPLQRKEVVRDADGEEHMLSVANLLAVVVPRRSPHYTSLYGAFNISISKLWRVMHDVLSVPLVVADEYCIDGLFKREIGDFRAPSGDDDDEDINAGSGGHSLTRYQWHGPILRNYWSDNRIGTGVFYLPLGPRQEFQVTPLSPSHNQSLKRSDCQIYKKDI